MTRPATATLQSTHNSGYDAATSVQSRSRSRRAIATLRPDVAAQSVTNSVMLVIARELLAFGLLGDITGDSGILDNLDRRLRDTVYWTVFPLVEKGRDPGIRVLVAATTAAAPPAQSRAQELVASGLLDLAVGIEDLAESLSLAVTNDLNGFVSHALVRSAIRRALVERINGRAGETR